MTVHEALEFALNKAGTRAAILHTRDLSGGCIHQVMSLTLADGTTVIAKINRDDQIKLFEQEEQCLRALAATKTVLVPQHVATVAFGGFAVLLMSEITAGHASSLAWSQFGEELAALHNSPAGERYGFEIDNHIGSTLQPNGWRDDWVEFNAVSRLGFQLDRALENDLLDSAEAATIQAVIDRLDRLIPRHPKPALLHGDLWSGNALPATNNRVAVIDPACSIGDGWADVAMMRLFGGFHQRCFDAYAHHQSDRDDIDERITIYQLYHVLNHVNMFGRGYVRQALSLARQVM